MAVGQSVDDIFLSILGDWVQLTDTCAEAAVEAILNNSGQYLSASQQKAVTDFHDLYFSAGDVADGKEAMNREVDDLFDAIQAEMAGGVAATSAISVKENDEAKRARLSLSGVQKQLETIIQLETGLKEKLVPVLTGMQFADAIKQRLGRMLSGWQLTLKSPPATVEAATAIAEKIGASLGSAVERSEFFPRVLKREAPKDMIDEMTLFDSFS